MKVRKKEIMDNEQIIKMYDHYIAIDWSIEKVSIARMRSNSIRPKIVDNIESNIKLIKEYLEALKGTKILTIEETTGAQWLYCELRDSVEKIIMCNPCRNRLLEEGSKTDKIDAGRLCQLLRSGLLKEVYHTDNENKYRTRKLVSVYDDLVSASVRIQNQMSAIYRSIGIKIKARKAIDENKIKESEKAFNFILDYQRSFLEKMDQQHKKFEEVFSEISRENPTVKNIKQISGFGNILAIKTYGIILDAGRFKNKYHLWSYCGLVRNKRQSGKRSFNKRNKQYSRSLKCVFKMATTSALNGKNDIREYYEFLLKQGYTEKDARNSVTRYLATSVYAVMKNRTKYIPYTWREKTVKKAA